MTTSNEISHIVGNTVVGVTGGATSVWLNQINEVLSTLVALATLIWLIISISKKVKDMRKGG
jgi:hypothetical protein